MPSRRTSSGPCRCGCAAMLAQGAADARPEQGPGALPVPGSSGRSSTPNGSAAAKDGTVFEASPLAGYGMARRASGHRPTGIQYKACSPPRSSRTARPARRTPRRGASPPLALAQSVRQHAAADERRHDQNQRGAERRAHERDHKRTSGTTMASRTGTAGERRPGERNFPGVATPSEHMASRKPVNSRGRRQQRTASRSATRPRVVLVVVRQHQPRRRPRTSRSPRASRP